MDESSTFDLSEEIAAIDSDDRSEVSDAYRSVKERMGHVHPQDYQYRFILDSTAGEMKERLSMMSFASERPDDGRRHQRRARNHYYWADNHQSHVLEIDDDVFAHYHRGISLFNLGRSMMLEAILEFIPFERYPDAYGYLGTDRRNHEKITRYLPETIETAMIVGMPERSGPFISNGQEALMHLHEMEHENTIALVGLSSRSHVERITERTKRADRLTGSYRTWMRFLDRIR